METGIVKHFNVSRGFGFITRDGQENDIFFHVTQVKGSPVKEGDNVEFEIGQGKDKRSVALNVTLSQ